MIKLHGFGGPSRFWDYNLESFTLMAGLAPATSRIQLFATCAVLTMPPPITARMAVTIDSISHGRFGVNIISGWQRHEYTQMGIWPGAEHYRRRYDYCAEYVSVMRELWETGHADLKGDFFQMDDCRCLPMPTGKIPIICAAQSDAGTRFAAQYADYTSAPAAGSTARLRWRRASRVSSMRRLKPDAIVVPWCLDPADGHCRRDRCRGDREMGTLQGRHRYRGAGLARRSGGRRSEQDPYAQPNRRSTFGIEKLPTHQGVFVGS